MSRRGNRALVLGAVCAAFPAGLGITWAYHYHRVALWVTVASAALLALCLWLCLRLTGEGKHGSKGGSRDEETAELFAKINRPAEIASEATWWKAEQEDRPQEMAAGFLAAPVHHDEYAPQQSYEGHAESSGGFLVQLFAPASALAATMRGLLREAARIGAREAEAEAQRLRDENRRLKDERDYPDLVGTAYPDWKTGAWSRELLQAALEAGEAS